MGVSTGGGIIGNTDAASVSGASADLIAQPLKDTPLSDWLRPYRVAWFTPATPYVLPLTLGTRTEVLRSNPGRLGFWLCVVGNAGIRVDLGVTGFPDGFVLASVFGGGTLSAGLTDLFSLCAASIFAIPTADCTLCVAEFARNQ